MPPPSRAGLSVSSPRVRTSSARLPMPTISPSRTTGTRFMPCVVRSRAISPTSVSSPTVTTGLTMTSRTRRSGARKLARKSGCSISPSARSTSHQSLRAWRSGVSQLTRSPSLTMPMGLPVSSTTGTALILLSMSILATLRVARSGPTETTLVVITSRAFIALPPALDRKAPSSWIVPPCRRPRDARSCLNTGSGARIPHRLPDALAGCRHLEAFDPERRKRTDDGVDDRRQRADCAGLTRALGAQWIALGRHRVRGDLHVRHRVGARHAVIHEAAGQVLPRFAVVDDLLHQSLAQPLRDAAMDLALEADRVHYGTDVVDDDVADDLQRAGIGVDLNLTDMAAIGIGIVVRGEGAGLVEAAFEAWRQAADVARRLSDVGDADAPVGAGDREIAIGEFYVGGGGFEQMRGNAFAFGDDLVGRHPQGRAANHRRARAIGADAKSDAVGIAVDVLHGRRIEPELFVQHLLEGGFVALALVLAAHQQGRVAAWVKADLGEFLAGSRRLLDRVGDADATQLSARLGLVAARGEAGPIGLRQCLLLVGGEIAAIVIEVQRGLVWHRRGRDQVLGPQFDRIEAQLARGVVDQAFDDIGRLGPAGAAIGRGAVGIGHHRQHRDVGCRDVISAGQRADIAEGRKQVAFGRDVGADIGQRLDPEAEEFAVHVEPQLGVADIVARVLVRLHGFTTFPHPRD